MNNYEILNQLKAYGIYIVSHESEGIIYTAVYCNYWVDRFETFPTTHNANDFTLYEASIYFIPKVLKMAGLRIAEGLI